MGRGLDRGDRVEAALVVLRFSSSFRSLMRCFRHATLFRLFKPVASHKRSLFQILMVLERGVEEQSEDLGYYPSVV